MKTHGKKYRKAAESRQEGQAYAGRQALELVKKEIGLEKGSGRPNRNKVGKITKAQIKKIAEIKMPDLNTENLESAMAMVAGAARSMGVEVVD